MKIINDMCIAAADKIKLQCGREYGVTIGEKERAPNLAKADEAKLKGLPTNRRIKIRK